MTHLSQALTKPKIVNCFFGKSRGGIEVVTRDYAEAFSHCPLFISFGSSKKHALTLSFYTERGLFNSEHPPLLSGSFPASNGSASVTV